MVRLALALLCGSVVLVDVAAATAQEQKLHIFTKQRLTDQFWAEGACVGDVNHDGHADVLCGPFCYAGPSYLSRTEVYPATQSFTKVEEDGSSQLVPGYEGFLSGKNGYSHNFISYVYDFNADGWLDYLVVGFPGAELTWYENPQNKAGHWPKHVVFAVLDNESPMWLDVDGDGRMDIVGGTTEPVDGKPRGFLGYASINATDPRKTWDFRKISPAGNWQRYTHGIGASDVNGDGRADILEAGGWWEQPASLADNPVWTLHKEDFGSRGAQMFAYDVNGDGLNDVITSQDAHGYGFAWFEQHREGGAIKFKRRLVTSQKPEDSPFGLTFTQPHAVDLADIDGDGLKDVVTGKRIWAHGPAGDAEPNAPAVLYWFQLKRGEGKSAMFVPHLIDDDSGIGTQVMAADVNGDNLLDIVVGNKKGAFVHRHSVKAVSADEFQKAQPVVKFPPVAGQ